MIDKTGIKAHDDAVLAAEVTRQVSEKAAAGSQAAVNSAWITYYRIVHRHGVAPSSRSAAHPAR